MTNIIINKITQSTLGALRLLDTVRATSSVCCTADINTHTYTPTRVRALIITFVFVLCVTAFNASAIPVVLFAEASGFLLWERQRATKGPTEPQWDTPVDTDRRLRRDGG